jgi:hypothetical protein
MLIHKRKGDLLKAAALRYRTSTVPAGILI